MNRYISFFNLFIIDSDTQLIAPIVNIRLPIKILILLLMTNDWKMCSFFLNYKYIKNKIPNIPYNIPITSIKLYFIGNIRNN